LDHLDVSDDILTFIAEHVVSNIRELEGSLTRVVAYSNLRRKPLNLDIAQEALKDLLPDLEKKEITPDLIKETVAEYYSISPESLLSERRDREVVLPRQVAMYLCHTMLGYPYKKIANVFEKNDHTTAINACRKVEDLLSSDKSFASNLDDIQKRLQ
jgi:chromosomal replication initiator protein